MDPTKVLKLRKLERQYQKLSDEIRNLKLEITTKDAKYKLKDMIIFENAYTNNSVTDRYQIGYISLVSVSIVNGEIVYNITTNTTTLFDQPESKILSIFNPETIKGKKTQ